LFVALFKVVSLYDDSRRTNSMTAVIRCVLRSSYNVYDGRHIFSI